MPRNDNIWLRFYFKTIFKNPIEKCQEMIIYD
jgi:hypothetical protein